MQRLRVPVIGRVLIAVALLPPTGVLAVFLWATIEAGPIAVLSDLGFDPLMIILSIAYCLGIYVVTTGRIPFASQESDAGSDASDG